MRLSQSSGGRHRTTRQNRIAQVDECYDFVENLPADFKEEVKHIDVEKQATLNAWSRDFCYVVLSALRRQDRTKTTLEPVLPFYEEFHRGVAPAASEASG